MGQTSWSLSREIPYSEVSLDWTKYNPISNDLYAVKETFYTPEEDRYQKENCPEWKNPSPKKTEYISLRDIAGDKADEVEALAQELSMLAKR